MIVGTILNLEVLPRLLHDLHSDLRLFTDVLEELTLRAVDQAVVAVDVLADLALIDGAVTRIVALLAALFLLIVRLQKHQLDLAGVVGHLEVEVPKAVFIQTLALVDERLPFLKEKQVHGQRQLLQTDLLGARLLGLDDADILLHGQLLRCLRFGGQLQLLSKPGLELLQLRVFFLH